ncbi:MAG: ispZ [Candidatus Nomurabacteria bacterium]|nr:ispZ [Candidatus Nomurabacteria bacterium]
MKKFPLFSPAIFKKVGIAAILEFGPIFVFLFSFNRFHVYQATMLLMVATIISTIITYTHQKRLPYVALFVALLTIIFGSLTIVGHQPKFIQIRDTLYDIAFSFILVGGLIGNVNFLKMAFHNILPMSTKAWEKMTYAWAIFMLFAAAGNEYIRRTGGLHDWFQFKAAMIPITVIFGLVVLYFSYETD